MPTSEQTQGNPILKNIFNAVYEFRISILFTGKKNARADFNEKYSSK